MVNIFFGKQNIYTWQQPPPTWISKRLRFPLKPQKVCHSVGIHARFIEVGKPNVQKITMMKNPILTWLSAFKITPSTFCSALFDPNLVVGAIWIYFIFQVKNKVALEDMNFQNAQKVTSRMGNFSKRSKSARSWGGGCVLLLPVMRAMPSLRAGGRRKSVLEIWKVRVLISKTPGTHSARGFHRKCYFQELFFYGW